MTPTTENIIEEIIESTKNKTCVWDGSNSIFGLFTSQMNSIGLTLWNLQDEKPSLTFEGYGTYRGGEILRNLVSAVLDQFPVEPARYPSHDSLQDPSALLRAWERSDTNRRRSSS
ncbi:hypothetical protein LCGC14_1076940 [marine sediment metagenome]|uniref:Uncharacterized protein n=1 Tax=marine sediment metagenome TaxID=412755 RepID=A0A0F9N3Z0_9ZZZZ